jgi:hypothetical protein
MVYSRHYPSLLKYCNLYKEENKTDNHIKGYVKQSPQKIFQVTHIFGQKWTIIFSFSSFPCFSFLLQLLNISSSIRAETSKWRLNHTKKIANCIPSKQCNLIKTHIKENKMVTVLNPFVQHYTKACHWTESWQVKMLHLQFPLIHVL